MFFVVLLYPFLILVALIALLIFCTLAVTLFSLFLIILPFIANCNHMDMELNDAVKRCCGPVAGFFIVILFYPIFFVVDFVQFLFIYILCRNLSNILEIVTYLLKGIRNVVLLPCLFFTSNSEYYEAQAQKEAERANRN